MENTEMHPINGLTSLRFGYYISLITAGLTAITFAIAIFTPPLSGPWCEASCFEYPYADIAGRFPRDYYWMYPAIFISFAFLMMVHSVHHVASAQAKLFSSMAVSFAIMSALTLISTYFIQLSVIQPSLLAGETEGIAMLTQFNPHGIFIVSEEIGYTLMVISLFCLIPVFAGSGSPRRALRWTFVVGLAVTSIALASISMQYGIQREYIFEIAVISITWIETIVAGILIARYFRKLNMA